MMGVACDLALALGTTMFGLCQPAVPPVAPPMPENDRSAWELPDPPPPPPRPAPPAMPPVVVKKEVIVERVVEKPAPPPPRPVVKKPDEIRLALEAAWSRGFAGGGGDIDPAVLVSGVRGGGSGVPGLLAASADPLALALAVPASVTPQYESPGSTSTLPVDNERILAADRYISGILETGINSQVGGEEKGSVVIQTSRDVYGYHGRLVLVPKGSRLICEFAPPKDAGSSRLELKCERILMAGHRAEIRDLGAPVGNAQGQAGVSGDVDRRFWERYGTAILLTGLSTAVRFAASAGTTDGTNTTTAASERAAEELSDRFGEITASVLEQTLSLVPIITIPQGTRVQIRPATDWYIADWKQS